MRVLGLILAGGEGRRMGGADKALVHLAGRPLLAHLCARLGPQVAALALSANGDPARFREFGLPVLADDAAFGPSALGPLAGILAGLRHGAGAGMGVVVSAPVDCPFLPGDLVAGLVAASRAGTRATHARSLGRDHPATALWPVALAGPLAAFLASGAKPRVRDFAARIGAVPVDFPDPRAFDNMNTPEDLARAGARIAAAAGRA